MNDFLKAIAGEETPPPPISETTPPPQPQPQPQEIGSEPDPLQVEQLDTPPPLQTPPPSYTENTESQENNSEAKAKTYAKMYCSSLNFAVPFLGSIIGGQSVSRYKASKEQLGELEEVATEFFQTVSWGVSPAAALVFATLGTFGVVLFKAFADRKEAQALKRRAEKAEAARQEAEQKALLMQRRAEAEAAKMQQAKEQAQEIKNRFKPKEPILKVMYKEAPEMPQAQDEATTNKDAKVNIFDSINLVDFVKLPEVAEQRNNFDLDDDGYYKMKADRGYYKTDEQGQKYKPCPEILNFINSMQGKEQRIINKKIRIQIREFYQKNGLELPAAKP